MAVFVDEARQVDAHLIADIHIASFGVTYRGLFVQGDLEAFDGEACAAAWRHRLRGDGRVWLAACDGEVRAFAWTGPSGDGDDDPARVRQLRSLHVVPAARGVGVGRVLLAGARERMREAGACEATLWVVEQNEHARRVYVRDGWEPDGARRRERLALPGGDGLEVVVLRMRRTLCDREAG